MKFGGQRDPRYLAPQHLARFAEEIGIGLRTAKIRMKEMIERVDRAIVTMGEGDDRELLSTPVVKAILQVIQQRERKMNSLL